MSPGNKPDHPGLLEDTSRDDLKLAWIERIEEAERLLQAGYRSMGVCLKVYALEARIKLRICDHLRLEYLPKICKTHDLNELIITTGLWAELNEPANASTKLLFTLLAQFSKLKLNSLRYEPRINLSDTEAVSLLEALDDPTAGVVLWLSKSR